MNAQRGALGKGWRYWRHRPRSYAVALFASLVVPFGIVYCGGVATSIIVVAWIVLLWQLGVYAIDLTEESTAVELASPVFAVALGVCVLHIVIPVVAVALHNMRVSRRQALA